MPTNFNQPIEPGADTEDEMLYCLQSNDQRDFSKLYDHFSAALSGILQRWVKDTETAENLLQDVFVKAWCNRDKYEAGKGRIFTWLYRITRNTCIDYFRSRPFRDSRVSVLGDDLSEIITLSTAKDEIIPDAIGLRKLVYGLRQEEKEVVDMMYFKGMTQRQIAEAMNIPLGTVKTRMNKAIKELRYYFKNDWKKAGRNISLN
jgi:RNA polymerase sigma-70 factor (ECF subfamily)